MKTKSVAHFTLHLRFALYKSRSVARKKLGPRLSWRRVTPEVKTWEGGGIGSRPRGGGQEGQTTSMEEERRWESGWRQGAGGTVNWCSGTSATTGRHEEAYTSQTLSMLRVSVRTLFAHFVTHFSHTFIFERQSWHTFRTLCHTLFAHCSHTFAAHFSHTFVLFLARK